MSPEPWEFHPQRERVRQAGAARAGGARRRTEDGCEESGDLRALPWLPHGSRRGTPVVFSSSSSPPKQLGEQLLRGKLEQWRQPKIFLQPLNHVFPAIIKDWRAGPRVEEIGLTAKSLPEPACWRCLVRTLRHTSLSSSTGFPDSKSLGFENVAYLTKLVVVVRSQGRG